MQKSAAVKTGSVNTQRANSDSAKSASAKSPSVQSTCVKSTCVKSVAVVGCGWFGLPLAQALRQEGFRVTGSKRHQEELGSLSELGIEAFALNLMPQPHAELCAQPSDGQTQDPQSVMPLLQTDYLVVNIPPRLPRGPQAYLQELRQLQRLTQGWQYQGIVFISSTGVYPAKDQAKDNIVAESDSLAKTPENEVLLAAEALFAEKAPCCIVRFAGLVGPKRHPGRFLAGKTDVSGANVAVNLVHLSDCVRAVTMILLAKSRGEALAPIYNLCAPIHPSKGEFYRAAAQSLGLVPPVFNQQSLPNKVVIAEAIVADLGFVYQYPSPLEMLAAC
ncbi:MAG: SDR family NAD(P)-dependent oxidoreductase [Shewanella sp.]